METIIVPTDFSEAATNAVNYAAELAGLFDARLILVHATPVPTSSYDNVVPAEMLNELRQRADEDLEKLKTHILSKPHRKLIIECYSDTGYAFDIIEEATNKYMADLIVMGIVGEAGKIKEHLIGSTSVNVARKINTPVFIIPEKVKYKRINKISFACDMERTEGTSLMYALRYFTNIFNADLEVVHVENPYEEVSMEKAKNTIFIEKKLVGVKHKTTYISNPKVAQALQDYFMLHPTDVVMLNPKKHNLFHNIFNESVTKELSFHLRLPILAIH